MSKKASLGRGLDALLSKKGETGAGSVTVQTLRIDRIAQAAYQPRQVFEPEALAELAQSIKEKGVLQPLLVRPRGDAFEIVAGERRWRASQLAGLTELPVIIRDLGDREALEIAIIENLQREDLGPLEEARAYQALLDQGLNQEGVAQAVGKGRSTVTNALRLLTLPEQVLQALDSGTISAGHARAILAQPERDRTWALEQIRKQGLNVREAEALKRGQGSSAPIKVNPPRTYRQLELDLSRRTGTRVKITGEDKGRVELSYASREELGRILELLGYAAEE
ncbi:chromosome segregation DNA-binding protein [Deinococcus reticulitermitis]|uniref:Chromosome segregation DNA-binding protein n=1 Tax=Deinococcus reticulitermitis TaxID=856736 RepID=A0A1H6YTF1_9DEIO|nr:ParB/RepB/Spo0J family partition protein ParB [Deinococcus reticulitermitis]SEJ43626.1 chromosome segregation DNA-binding protein [Deinococcus reticulitermitis]